MDGKGSTILQQHLFECARDAVFICWPDTLGDSPFNQRLHEQGERRFAQLVAERACRNLMGINQLQGIEMMVQSSDTDLVAACPAVTSMAGVMARLRKQNWQSRAMRSVRQVREKLLTSIMVMASCVAVLFGDKIRSPSHFYIYFNWLAKDL